MSTAISWKALEDKIARVVKQARGAVAVSFRDSEPADVKKFEGTRASGMQFLEAGGGRENVLHRAGESL
jgi:hypothetical protein